jgi:hypothetical protein
VIEYRLQDVPGAEPICRLLTTILDAQRAATPSLFPEDREIPTETLDGVPVKLAEMELRRPRAFGNYWLGCELRRQLGLEAFWEARLGEGREEVPWAKVSELRVVSRLVSPGTGPKSRPFGGASWCGCCGNCATCDANLRRAINCCSAQMLDVCLPTTDGRWLIMPRYTQPEPDQALMLHQLNLSLPSQPPPRSKVQEERAQTVQPTLKMSRRPLRTLC